MKLRIVILFASLDSALPLFIGNLTEELKPVNCSSVACDVSNTRVCVKPAHEDVYFTVSSCELKKLLFCQNNTYYEAVELSNCEDIFEDVTMKHELGPTFMRAFTIEANMATKMAYGNYSHNRQDHQYQSDILHLTQSEDPASYVELNSHEETRFLQNLSNQNETNRNNSLVGHVNLSNNMSVFQKPNFYNGDETTQTNNKQRYIFLHEFATDQSPITNNSIRRSGSEQKQLSNDMKDSYTEASNCSKGDIVIEVSEQTFVIKHFLTKGSQTEKVFDSQTQPYFEISDHNSATEPSDIYNKAKTDDDESKILKKYYSKNVNCDNEYEFYVNDEDFESFCVRNVPKNPDFYTTYVLVEDCNTAHKIFCLEGLEFEIVKPEQCLNPIKSKLLNSDQLLSVLGS